MYKWWKIEKLILCRVVFIFGKFSSLDIYSTHCTESLQEEPNENEIKYEKELWKIFSAKYMYML